MRVLIGYFSKTGNTKEMAEIIANTIKDEGAEVILKQVDEISAEELVDVDAIILGSPTYYGSMAWQIKRLLDESVKFHGKLEGKVGACFTSSANIGGGNESTLLDILHAFLIHGMIVQGISLGDHYGPVSIGNPDERCKKQCRALGRKVCELVKRLKKQ